MDSPPTLRVRAADYRRLAEATVDPEARRLRLSLADYLDRMAAEQENGAQPDAGATGPT
jgi:hypothetical protein